jgi:hypothetical protein
MVTAPKGDCRLIQLTCCCLPRSSQVLDSCYQVACVPLLPWLLRLLDCCCLPMTVCTTTDLWDLQHSAAMMG